MIKEQFVLTKHPKPVDVLAKARSKDVKTDVMTGVQSILINGVLIQIDTQMELDNRLDTVYNLGTNTHKLLNFCIMKLIKQNSNNNNLIDTIVTFSIKEYAQYLGKNLQDSRSRRNALTNLAKQIGSDLGYLCRMRFEFKQVETKRRKNKETGEWFTKKETVKYTLAVVGSHSINAVEDNNTGVTNGHATMCFDAMFARYVLKSAYTQFPASLFHIDSRNANAYIIGLRMFEYYNIPKNKKAGINNRLKVATLLEWTNLPNYENVAHGTQRNWNRLIREPFEKALIILANEGVLAETRYDNKGNITQIGYRYVKPLGEPFTDKEIENNGDGWDYNTWANTLIEFTPANTENMISC